MYFISFKPKQPRAILYLLKVTVAGSKQHKKN